MELLGGFGSKHALKSQTHDLGICAITFHGSWGILESLAWEVVGSWVVTKAITGPQERFALGNIHLSTSVN